MAASQTKTRLLDAAEQLFAEAGFEGASIRAITAAAGTDLGSARYHFGSKEGLFHAALARRLAPLNKARLARLAELKEATGTPTVEAALEAFIRPALELLLDPGHGAAWIKLLARLRVDPERLIAPTLPDLSETVTPFLEALRTALPRLPERELLYRWHFFFGVQVNTLLDRWSLRALGGPPDIHDAPEDVLKRLIAFAAAGLRAP